MVSVLKKGEVIGYLFVTKDITSSKGYASLTFDILVGLQLDGKIAGAKYFFDPTGALVENKPTTSTTQMQKQIFTGDMVPSENFPPHVVR